MRRPALTLGLGPLLVSLFAGSLPAETPPETPPLKQGVRGAVEVTAMDLDVVATQDGKPVDDLRKDEVLVRVDGKALPVDYFARIDAGTVHGPDLATASPDFILQTTANATGERFVPRQFLVFFDDEHLLPGERSRVIESLRDFVTRLSPADRVSLVSNGTAARVIVPYTASKEDLLDGLEKLANKAPGGIRWESEFKRTVLELRRTGRASTRDALLNQWSQQVLAREKGTLDELKRSVSALAARPGKRVLLYVSNGFELYPGQTLKQALGPSLLAQFDLNVLDRYRDVLDTANRAGITIDCLDAKGLTTDGDASDSAPSPFNTFFYSQSLREPMAGMAKETGGILVTNRNEFGPALDRIYREASSYYSVGVTLSSLDPKTRVHKVEVTTTRSGITLRTRSGYTPNTADDAARDRMEMALMNPDAAGEFAVMLTTQSPKSGAGLARRIVPFLVAIPISELTFSEGAAARTANLEITMAAVQDNGARSDIKPDRLTIAITEDKWDAMSKKTWVYSGEMMARKGNMRFVTTVRDIPSGRVAIASTPVRLD